MLTGNAPALLTAAADQTVTVAAGGDRSPGSKKVAALVTSIDADQPLTTAFNPKYLADGLAALAPKGRVTMMVTAATRPVVLTTEQDADTRAFLYLLMPVRR